MTEPENLGACEPGTSVNLEGIVWHETDTGKYKTRHQIQSNRKTIFYHRNYFLSHRDTKQKYFLHSQLKDFEGKHLKDYNLSVFCGGGGTTGNPVN